MLGTSQKGLEAVLFGRGQCIERMETEKPRVDGAESRGCTIITDSCFYPPFGAGRKTAPFLLNCVKWFCKKIVQKGKII